MIFALMSGDPDAVREAVRVIARPRCKHCQNNPPRGHTCPRCGRVSAVQ